MFVFCAYVAPFVMLLHLGYCMAFYIAFFFWVCLLFPNELVKFFGITFLEHYYFSFLRIVF